MDVYYSLSGSAILDVDFTAASSNKITIPAKKKEVDLEFPTLADKIKEETETITVTIITPPISIPFLEITKYDVTDDYTATADIVDYHPIQVHWEVEGDFVVEYDGANERVIFRYKFINGIPKITAKTLSEQFGYDLDDIEDKTAEELWWHAFDELLDMTGLSKLSNMLGGSIPTRAMEEKQADIKHFIIRLTTDIKVVVYDYSDVQLDTFIIPKSEIHAPGQQISGGTNWVELWGKMNEFREYVKDANRNLYEKVQGAIESKCSEKFPDVVDIEWK